jgi:hypothetical protein
VRLTVAAAAGVAALALALAAQAPARTGCTAGVKTVKGVTYRTFCGPAKAQVTVHAVDHRFDGGGLCTRSGGTFSINVGTITLPPGKPKFSYFGITVFKAHDGTFKNQAVGWQLPGTGKSIIGGTITLSHGMRRGTFSGKIYGTNQLATGGFVCSGTL